MKKIIFSLVLISTFSFSQSHPQRSILDLMYLPEEGAVTSTTSLAYIYSKAKFSRVDAHLKSNYFILAEELGYSFSDASVVSLEASYSQLSAKFVGDDVNSAVEGKSFKAKGFDTLTLSFRQRLMDQQKRRQAVNLDLYVNISPKLGKDKSPSLEKDGTPLNNQYSIKVGTQIGKIHKEKNHFAADFSVQWNGEAESEDLEDNSVSKTDSNFEINLEGEYQHDFNSRNALTAAIHLAYSTPEKLKDTELKSTDLGLTPSLGLSYKYALSSSMIIEVGTLLSKVSNDSDVIAKSSGTAYTLLSAFSAVF